MQKPDWFNEVCDMLTDVEKQSYQTIWSRYELFNELPEKKFIVGNVKYIWPLTRNYIDECRKKEEPSTIRNSMEYRQWRMEVYERDGYTCQICGAVGGQLNAHHIKPFALYPELRLDVNNGVTLCKQCHKAVHRKKAV